MKCQVGQNICALRRKRQVSQEDLAETLCVSAQAVSKWETGKANPDLAGKTIIKARGKRSKALCVADGNQSRSAAQLF